MSQSLAPSILQSKAPSATQPTSLVSSAVKLSDGTSEKQTSDDEGGKCFVLIRKGRFYRGLHFAVDERSLNNHAFFSPCLFYEFYKFSNCKKKFSRCLIYRPSHLLNVHTVFTRKSAALE